MMHPEKDRFAGQYARGFTLVELLVAMFLTFIAAVGMYKMLVAYTASSEIMDQLVELQQNSRIAMERMGAEIRMAGYDPTTSANARISPTSTSTRFIFSMDWNEDGDVLDPGEALTYSMADLDGDGVNDLVRDDTNPGGSGPQQVITNLSALEFIYADKDGNAVVVGTLTSSVEIAMVIKTTNEDYRITDTFNYQTRRAIDSGSGAILYTPPADDHFRRKLVEQTVKCRNSGL